MPGAGPPTPRAGPASPTGAPAAGIAIPRPTALARPDPAAPALPCNGCCSSSGGGPSRTSDTISSPRKMMSPSTRRSSRCKHSGSGFGRVDHEPWTATCTIAVCANMQEVVDGFNKGGRARIVKIKERCGLDDDDENVIRKTH